MKIGRSKWMARQMYADDNDTPGNGPSQQRAYAAK